MWRDHTDDVDELAQRLSDTEVLVLIRERTPIRTALLERLDNLQLISQRSVFPHIDVETCTRLGIVVSSDLHQGTASVRDRRTHVGTRDCGHAPYPPTGRIMKRGHWQDGVGHSLVSKTLGIYGYGRIGRVVADYGRAFGMTVVFWASEGSRARAVADGAAVAASREEFFEVSDVLTLHMRLADATRGIVTAADLDRMKPTALLVNTSRAGLIAPGVLVHALKSGHPGLAALDVFDVEPLVDTTNPLLTMDNVICTPHVGYVTVEEWEIQFSDIFDQITSFAMGTPTNVVNPLVLTRRRGG